MTQPPSAPRVTLYVRGNCHLCVEARAIIAAVCADLGESFEEIDIDNDLDLDPALALRFDEEVPVTFVDGKQHDFWRVSAERLRAALTA